MLLVGFFGSWTIKVRTTVQRPQDADDGIEHTVWYENSYSAPKPDDGWVLDPEIPLNYVPVPGADEVYMVMTQSGEIQKYRQRRQLSDGTWQWSDVDYDSNGMEAVSGQDGLYTVTGEDGKKKYKKYVRNDDKSYCYVDTDSSGKPLDIGTSAETITPNYVHLDGNTYAKYNDDGVLEGYRERVKDDSGAYVWALGSLPTMSSGGFSIGMPAVNAPSDGSVMTNGVSVPPIDETPQTIPNGDGTYTEKETIVNTETVDGQQITYQTVVTRTLLNTSSDGPYEVGRETLGSRQQPNPSNIAGSLEAEVSRVSASVSYDTAMAQDILALLNAERTNAGLPQLIMDTRSEAYKVALIKAADMATYDYASASSPTYGTIGDIVARFSLASASPSENIWKASSQTAQDVHTRFQSNSDSRTVRMSTGYTSVGIAVVQKSGQTYVAEVYLQ